MEKEKEKEKGKESEVSKKDLWHFSEYFHGGDNQRRRSREICPDSNSNSRNCRIVDRLTEGGYSPRDLAHLLIFRHREGREGSMLKHMGKLNPIVFQSHKEAKKTGEPYKPSLKNTDFLLELVKEVIRNDFIEDLLCKGPQNPRISLKNLETSQIEYFQIMQIVEQKMIHPRHEEYGTKCKGEGRGPKSPVRLAQIPTARGKEMFFALPSPLQIKQAIFWTPLFFFF